jgi:putative transposase
VLTEDQVIQFYDQLKLSPQARLVVDHIRSSPPVRRVGQSPKSVTVRYPSRKMGCIIQAESHRNELAFIHELEYDETVLEYYDQPMKIKLVYQARHGRKIGVWHTPDFFVLRSDRFGWEECKTEADLNRLVERMPKRYVKDEASMWRCPPGERYAEQFGFYYHVRSSAEINWGFQRNLIFLQDYLRSDCPAVSEAAAEEISRYVIDQPGIRLDTLLTCVKRATSDDIYTLIANGQVYADIQGVPLAEPERVHLFRDQWTAQATLIIPDTVSAEPPAGLRRANIAVNVVVHWDGRAWTIINVGETAVWLRSDDQQVVELSKPELQTLIDTGALVGSTETQAMAVSDEVQKLLAKTSPADLRVANQRYEQIRPLLTGGSPANDQVPERTLRDWLRKYRSAERVHQCGYVGLLPRLHQSGNRIRKLPAETWSLMNEFITDSYETVKQKRKYEVYGELLLACEKRGVQAPSYKTFAQAIKQRSGYQQTQKREGHRRAYAQEPFYWTLEMTTPRHGDRPFEIGHLDHTWLDIELIHATTGRNLGRPWATILTDAFSRRLLAVYLSFEAPSYRACMMILRECVRRQQRMPQCLVVDGGPEFGSVYFESLLARYECTKKTRPSHKSRFGSVCERLFGTTNTRFIYTLTGNTQITRHARQVSRAVDPKNHAAWTLERLYIRFRQWAYEVYDTIEHPALGQTPREAFACGMRQSGQRPQRIISYDEDFYINTLPTTRKGTAKVDANRGVKINYIYYWSNDFRHPEVQNTQVPVRYDPFDMGVAYAFVQGQWVRCTSEHYARLKGRSESEIRVATAELLARNRRHSRQLAITARHIAHFTEELQQEEAAQEKLLRAAESKRVVRLINQDQAETDPDPVTDAEGETQAEVDDLGEYSTAPANDEPFNTFDDYSL